MSAKSERKRRIKAQKQAAAALEFVQRNWFPIAAELKLPEVPEHARYGVRSFLSGLLGNIPVENGNCWQVAQQLMLVANSPRVAYVEGCWGHQGHYIEHLRGECSCAVVAAPHGWNLVDGHVVDLMAELKLRIPDQPHPNVWLYELFKVYSPNEFNRYITQVGIVDGLSFSVRICIKGFADEFGLSLTQQQSERIQVMTPEMKTPEPNYEKVIFEPAEQRLLARLQQNRAAA